jgi:hypothetical protein
VTTAPLIDAGRVLDEGVEWLADVAGTDPPWGTRVTVYGFGVDVLHWHWAIHEQLVQRLTPFYEVTSMGRCPGTEVAARLRDQAPCSDQATLVVVEHEAKPPDQASTPYRVRHSQEALRYRRGGARWAGGRGWAALDQRSGTISAGAWHSGLAVLLGTRPRGLAKDCRRAVQDIARLAMIERAGLYIEGAAVAHQRDVVIAVGPGGAGKTTWLASMLAEGRGSFVANDEVLLVPGAPAQALGAPVHVMVRRDLAARFPAFEPVVAHLGPDEPKRSMLWHDFAAVFGATVRPGGRLAGIVVLEPGSALALVDPGEAPALLEPARLWGPDWITPWTGIGPAGWSVRDEGPSLAAIVASCPVVRFGRSGDVTRALRLLG